MRHAVEDYATAHEVPQPPLEDLKLAVTEAVSNAVLHAFRSSAPGTVTVRMDVAVAESVTLTVRDDGEGMSPRVDSPGLGMGLPLISALATSTEVRTPPTGHGTELMMHFAFGGTG